MMNVQTLFMKKFTKQFIKNDMINYILIGLLYSMSMKLIRDFLIQDENIEDFSIPELVFMTVLWPVYSIVFIFYLFKKD